MRKYSILAGYTAAPNKNLGPATKEGQKIRNIESNKEVVWDGPIQKVMLIRTAAAAAKSLQSCPTLCNPIDGSPPGAPVPGILQARTLEWVAISFSNAWKWKVKSESEVTQSCPTLSNPMDCSFPGSSVHGIFQARVLGWYNGTHVGDSANKSHWWIGHGIWDKERCLGCCQHWLPTWLSGNNPPASEEPKETWVQSLGWEDPLEEEMATHPRISCLENPMDGEAWWATVHGVPKSQTWLSDWTCMHWLASEMGKSLPLWVCAYIDIYTIKTCLRDKDTLFTTSPLTLILPPGHSDYSHPHPASTTRFILLSFKIFLMWTTSNIFIEFVTTLFLFYVLVFWPWGIWNLP